MTQLPPGPVRINVTEGDCVEVLRARTGPLFDAVVTDPPYELGFMGRGWDKSGVAFSPETWRAIYDQMKPGAHLVAFSGTRTYHRMAVAIEDAGFEIRDQLAWAYGSGFPKSLDVSKAIDKRGGNSHLASEVGAAIKAARVARGMTKREADVRYCGGVTLWSWYEGRPAGQQMPSGAVMAMIARDWPELNEYAALIAEAEREIVGQVDGSRLAVAPGQGEDRAAKSIDVTTAKTDAAAQWSGWGTALKPAWEPICLARKSLDGTVAGNVLAHGVGGLNIDGCRIDSDTPVKTFERGAGDRSREDYRTGTTIGPAILRDLGRFPANLLHDGSDEVVALFPEQSGGGTPAKRRSNKFGEIFGGFEGGETENGIGGSSGNASRFFYSAKAGPLDRLGSEHPTVKPVDVMRWLIRLVCPPGGLLLDPFAGSGTTGIAALAERMNAELIDLVPAHVADITRKLAHLRGEGGRVMEQHLRRKAARAAPAKGLTLFD